MTINSDSVAKGHRPVMLLPVTTLMPDISTLFAGSLHSYSYAAYRPSYPDVLFEELAEFAGGSKLAWDVACGTGQASFPLSSVFDTVIASDVSESQLSCAKQAKNINYKLMTSSETPYELEEVLGTSPGSVDLITVAQALHWFCHDAFFNTVKYFLRPGGVFAAWTYALTPWFPAEDKHIEELHKRILNGPLRPYWPSQWEYIERNYVDIPFPFERELDHTESPYAVTSVDWTLDSMLGYISSLSAYQLAIKEGIEDPIAELRQEISEAWGEPDRVRTVGFPIYLVAGRKPYY